MNSYFSQNIIMGMIESMLPRFSNDKLGLLLKFNISGNFNQRVSKRIYYLIFRPSNYTKVLVKFPDKDEILLPIENEFYLKSDHDSCWRSDGFHDIFEQLCKMRDLLLPNESFSKCGFNISFDLLSKPSYYLCDYEIHDNHRYDNEPIKILLTSKLTIQEAVGHMPK